MAAAVSVAQLVAQPEIAFDADRRDARSSRLATLRMRAASPSLEALLAAATPQREEVLAVLHG
jgi:hypothetical protein